MGPLGGLLAALHQGVTVRWVEAEHTELLVAFEAVLNPHQLPEVRHMVAARLETSGEQLCWAAQLVTQELCLAAMSRSARCAGLRVYRVGDAVRVEVDEPRCPSDPDRLLSSAHDIVRSVADRFGVGGAAARHGVDPRPGVVTAWCELDVRAPVAA